MAPSTHLRADLYSAPAIPTSEILPDGTTGHWQPTVVTLISGATSAVLVDTLFTAAQGVALGDWIADTLGRGRRLTTIYITHGHGDHWFNVAYLQSRFAGVRVLATAACVAHMRTQLTPEYRALWHRLFPGGQIEERAFEFPVVETLGEGNNMFEVEGHVFEAVEVGHSDTEGTTFLHVPDLDLVVAGDVVYNDVHMWMAESVEQEQRDAWVRSLEKIEEYRPGIVIGSHHRPGGVDGAFNIGASQEYIRTFSRLVRESSNAKELYEKVLSSYPNRIGLAVLWLGCKAIFPPGSKA
ncbi:Beta-lactamase-like protein [Macrophomina phaseolina MS6]|uniref:Beta-lactamase-like protein n=1 Tax=Macrophomina phaseolina (strain MS6) TaxID=1126212 RepID=K2S4Y9_MACPH|nr:Beta-lactamase-like protein [Macrophomina phaseolina MS6]